MRNGIDISKLTPPELIKTLNYEQVRGQMAQRLRELLPNQSLLASDPAIKVLETLAYRETLLRTHINKMAAGVLLGISAEAETEYLAARLNVERKANESLDAFTARTVDAMESRTSAGSVGAYYNAVLAAHDEVVDCVITRPTFERVNNDDDTFTLRCADDAGLTSPTPGDIAITVLTKSGAASNDVLQAVAGALTPQYVRPMSDTPRVRSVQVVNYRIQYSLTVGSGPDPLTVRAASKQAVQALLESLGGIGQPVYISQIIAAASVPGVLDVQLISPATNITCDAVSAAHCESVEIA